MIELKNVSFTYMPGTPFAKAALNGINFSWNEGEKIALIGACGSGKSTLVQHLNGLIAPTAGQVFIDGVEINVKKRLAFDLFGDRHRRQRALVNEARRKVGVVFQYPEQQLFEETVFADVAFGVKKNGRIADDGQLAERVKEALADVALSFDDVADCSPFALSGGQMRRVAIAGILVLKPKYLVLDEPTAGLDPKNRRELMRQIEKFAAKNKTAVLLVTHSMDMAAEFADRIIVMGNGKILADGTPKTVFHDEQGVLATAGLAPPPITRLLVRLNANGVPVDPSVTEYGAGVAEIRRCYEEVRNVR